MYETGTQGSLVYLNARPDLQLVLDRINDAGGKVLVPTTRITDEYGYLRNEVSMLAEAWILFNCW